MDKLNAMPSYQELVKTVHDMKKIIDRHETTIAEFRTWMATQKRKISILDWLASQPRPYQSFGKWFETLEVTIQDVDYLEDHDYFETFANIFRKHIDTTRREYMRQMEQEMRNTSHDHAHSTQHTPFMDMEEEDQHASILPVRAFAQRSSYLYVYDSATSLRSLNIPIKSMTEDKREDKREDDDDDDDDDDKPDREHDEQHRLRWYCIPIKSCKGILNLVIKQYCRMLSTCMTSPENRTNSANMQRIIKLVKKSTTASDNIPLRVSRIFHKVANHIKENRRILVSTPANVTD